MFASNTYNPFETGLTNAKTVVGLEWLYESARKQIGKLLLVAVVVFLAFPVVLLFGYWFQRKRTRFQSNMRNDFGDFHSVKDYLEYKIYLNKVATLTPSLKKVSSYNLKKAPWPLKYTLSQMQKMTSTLLTYNSWLKSRLDSLNEEQFKSDSSVFKFVSEEELWRNRNQAYQYWM